MTQKRNNKGYKLHILIKSHNAVSVEAPKSRNFGFTWVRSMTRQIWNTLRVINFVNGIYTSARRWKSKSKQRSWQKKKKKREERLKKKEKNRAVGWLSWSMQRSLMTCGSHTCLAYAWHHQLLIYKHLPFLLNYSAWYSVVCGHLFLTLTLTAV